MRAFWLFRLDDDLHSGVGPENLAVTGVMPRIRRVPASGARARQGGSDVTGFHVPQRTEANRVVCHGRATTDHFGSSKRAAAAPIIIVWGSDAVALISVAEALDHVLGGATPLPPGTVPLASETSPWLRAEPNALTT